MWKDRCASASISAAAVRFGFSSPDKNECRRLRYEMPRSPILPPSLHSMTSTRTVVCMMRDTNVEMLQRSQLKVLGSLSMILNMACKSLR